MSHFVYIIQSDEDGSFCIGSSSDPVLRLRKHNAAHKGYTAGKQLWRLVYVEEFPGQNFALARLLERQKSADFPLRLIFGSSEANANFVGPIVGLKNPLLHKRSIPAVKLISMLPP